MNAVILIGRLNRPASIRLLPAGGHVVELDIDASNPGDRQELVPVAIADAPTSISTLDVGAEVVVVGKVRRRFFRSGGQTASRTEVLATSVTPLRHRKKSASVLINAICELETVHEAQFEARSQVG